jgi:hypothetical protein
MGCVDQHVIPTRVRRSNLEAPGRRDFELLEHVVGIGPRPLNVPVCVLWPRKKVGQQENVTTPTQRSSEQSCFLQDHTAPQTEQAEEKINGITSDRQGSVHAIST